MSRPIVYISGPITKGNRNHNFFQACEAEVELMQRGYAPVNPMRSMILPFAWQQEFTLDLWLECDFALVEVSQAVLRLPGESTGGDRETAHAESLGIPVVYSIEELESVLCPASSAS